jgi:hypothetical protein
MRRAAPERIRQIYDMEYFRPRGRLAEAGSMLATSACARRPDLHLGQPTANRVAVQRAKAECRKSRSVCSTPWGVVGQRKKVDAE